MCKIENLLREISFENVILELSNSNNRGFSLEFQKDSKFFFRTSSNSKYRIRDKVIIAVNSTTNSLHDKMIPHKEMRKIFSNFGVEKVFVDQLKKTFPNVVFIAKNPQFLAKNP
jgi:hypothetical protein